MNRYLLFSTLFILFSLSSYSQAFTDSNLPIVIINTSGSIPIPDDPRISATMKIIYSGEGQRNYLSDENNPAFLNYNGNINIELRGSSSQVPEKKQYSFSTKKEDFITNNNVSLLGLPADNDWILNGMVFDPSMIRNYLSFYLSRAIGEYASRTVYCEVVLNGSYNGLYLLQEKIKAGPDRVNILEIGRNDTSYPDISGGYIVKADKTTGNDPVAWYMSSYQGTDDVQFIHEFPDPDNITYGQTTFIKAEFQKLASAAASGNSSFENGYPSVIDVPSFVDFLILNEISANVDAYQISTFFSKDRNGKLRAGPIWDMDLTYGNDLFMWGFDRSKIDKWQFSNGDNEGPRFWKDLFYNQKFNCYFSTRWYQLTRQGQPLAYSSIEPVIDQIAAYIGEAAVREDRRWATIDNFPYRIMELKTFLNQRITWMIINSGYSMNCINVEIPPLTITGIMYDPDTSLVFPVSKDLEFLEIKNTGDKQVSLTGIYFRGTGFVYQFPANSTVGAGESVILAGNAAVFREKYGFLPFGQFTRNLSNTGEDLVLADGFGNVIDRVNYSDQPPWPDVKANGFYLELIDPLSDNNDGANWIASQSTIVSVNDNHTGPDLKLFPSPVSDKLRIEASGRILSVQLFDIYGRLLRSLQVDSESCYLEMKSCLPGMYLVRVVTPSGSLIRKVIRE